MRNLKYSLFELAEIQLQKETKIYTLLDILDYTVRIRYYLDLKEEAKAQTQFKKCLN